jgi:alpha-galactosidase
MPHSQNKHKRQWTAILVWFLAAAFTCVNPSRPARGSSAEGLTLDYTPGGEITLRSAKLVVRISPGQSMKVALRAGTEELSLGSGYPQTEPSDYPILANRAIRDFAIDYPKIARHVVQTNLGPCARIEIPSRAIHSTSGLRKVLQLDLCSAFPQTLILATRYENLGERALRIDRTVQLAQVLTLPPKPAKPLWTFQGASLGWGWDFIFPVPAAFHSQNPMGQIVKGGFGGGIPVNDFWNGRVGMGMGHIEPGAVECWMPVEPLEGKRLRLSFVSRAHRLLAPGASFQTPRVFVTLHTGDFYDVLATYAAMLKAQGVDFMKASDDLYKPFWWTFGLGHNFRPEEVYNAIPMCKELGIGWIIINNRWWDHYGDWMPRKDKFRDEAGFKEMLDRLHQEGLRAILWWMPYAVQLSELPRSGLYQSPGDQPEQSPAVEAMVAATAGVARQHRDWLIQDARGRVVPIPRNLACLCPAYQPARDYMLELARRMMRDWGADGLYMDVIYTVPPCYNPAHHHASPYDSVRQLASLFAEFRKIVEQHSPQGMLMICPCGTTMNHCLLPHMNEPVTADPVGPEQIRWRIKMYKALLGPRAPVFADRVESTRFKTGRGTNFEVGSDFASCMGTGGIIGSLFIWPKIDKEFGDLEFRGEMEGLQYLLLTSEKEALWKKWYNLYREKMLADGEFLNLYTLGFDQPEGYAIRKNGKMYYAFFAPVPRPWGLDSPPLLPEPSKHVWRGRLELRGLDKATRYRVVDYAHAQTLGELDGASPFLETEFTDHLLLEVQPAP